MSELITRNEIKTKMRLYGFTAPDMTVTEFVEDCLESASAQLILYGYNIEHLVLIATILRKENLPPERVAEVLTDYGRIVAIARVEFEETLRKAVEQCTI